MKKLIKIVVFLAILIVVGFKSVYFRKLDEMQVSAGSGLDVAAYTANYFKELNPLLDTSVNVVTLYQALKNKDLSLVKSKGHSLSLGSLKYIMVSGQGIVAKVDSGSIIVNAINNEMVEPVYIETEFIFGNAIRDASGIVKLSDFTNTTDLNNVSSEINKTIRETVVKPFVSTVQKGDTISFNGAIEINEKYLNVSDLQVMPIRLK
ncbi:DUF2291 family protein [Polluticaenibacter yanchengensis]|uniref:DUF2291 family protein n=1 Tax=Polluticaenibacter yanchengensis TaxID=3014562 RepID=A0ABT4UJ46_9BACT|nr:DUF2291 family protein [Chitinophagaceae bacterium LY-5]